jgi:hypothetical protein
MDEILVNTSIAGDQQASAVAGFRGTQYVVVWEDGGDAKIKGQMFGVNGLKSGSEFVVNLPGEPGTSRRLPAIVECSLGFAVAWIEKPRGAAAQVKLRTFDQDTLSGPEIQVSTSEIEALTAPAIARLADGGFVVVWADKRQDERIRAQRFGLQGEKNGPEFRANTIPGLHREPMAACLTNGNIVIGWRARSAAPLLVHLQIFDSNGAALGGEQITNLDITDFTMAALDSGRFVIAHLRNAFDGETGFETTVVQASVFEPNGVFTGIRIAASSEQRIVSTWPTLAPLPGGRCVLAWTQINTDAPAGGTNVRAKVFSASQSSVGQAVQVNTLSGGERFRLCAAATPGPDGETVFFSWSDQGQAGDGTLARRVRGRPLPILPSGGLA